MKNCFVSDNDCKTNLARDAKNELLGAHVVLVTLHKQFTIRLSETNRVGDIKYNIYSSKWVEVSKDWFTPWTMKSNHGRWPFPWSDFFLKQIYKSLWASS
jgi:hypothetical protein